MARTIVHQSGNVALQSAERKLPYKSHPIYHLRKRLIVIAIVGLFLSFLAYDPYRSPFSLPGIFFLVLSILFGICDVILYAMKKVQNPDEDPEWPKVVVMVMDAVMAFIHQTLFWAGIVGAEFSYGHNALIGGYSALCYLVCSLVHVHSFWRQLKARFKAKWLSKLTPVACNRCGYTEGAEDTVEAPFSAPANVFPYAGPSASYEQAPVVTPNAQESAMEEGLLIGSDFGCASSYGTIDTPETTIDQDEQVVVPKGKKKRTPVKEERAGRA